MPIVYLEPADLSALQAQQVLDFLNRDVDAERLGRDIEFPGEPDIGPRLGRRLLDARAALGGAFTAIAQVRAVRLIGPERFTEICVAALGLHPRRWVDLFFAGAPLAAQPETGLTVSLDVLPQPAWLGQPLALTVRVRDHAGNPRAGVPVTVQTGIGRLVYMFGFSRIEGAAVTVLSGGDGSADLDLLTPPSEPLSEIQQATLEIALSKLDAGAPDPLKLEAAFRTLADDYVLERNYNLRRAIDVHVRDRRDAMVDSLNPGRWRLAWPIDSALVQADATAADGGGSSIARAVVAVTWKNWVGAWLEFLADVLRERAKLAERLAEATRAERGGAIVADLLFEARRFVAGQPGRAAEWVGKREIDVAMRDYVSGDLAGLEPAAQAAVLTQLEVAASEVRPTTFGNYTLVSRTRADLSDRIANLDAFSALNLASIERMAADIDAKASAIDTKAAQIDARAAQVDAQAQNVATLAASVEQDRVAVSQDRIAIDQRIDRFDGRLSQVGTRLDQFDSQFNRFSTNLNRFDADLATFNSNRTTLTTRIDRMQTDLQTVRLDVNNLGRPRGGGEGGGGG